MNAADDTTRPLPVLIIVSGRSCAGKTTLAHRLAARFRLPLMTKEHIKETLFDSLGWRDRAWSKQLGAASAELLYPFAESQVAARQSCIVESNFSAAFATPAFQRMKDRHPFLPIQINCVGDPAVFSARFRGRALSDSRHPGHQDHLTTHSRVDKPIPGSTDPLDIGGDLMVVDTTDFGAVDYEALFGWIEGIMDRKAHRGGPSQM